MQLYNQQFEIRKGQLFIVSQQLSSALWYLEKLSYQLQSNSQSFFWVYTYYPQKSLYTSSYCQLFSGDQVIQSTQQFSRQFVELTNRTRVRTDLRFIIRYIFTIFMRKPVKHNKFFALQNQYIFKITIQYYVLGQSPKYINLNLFNQYHKSSFKFQRYFDSKEQSQLLMNKIMKLAGVVKTQPEVVFFESYITIDGLKIIISLNGGQRDGQIFQGIISSLTCQENLLQHFDSLQDLMQYINKQENRIINIDQRYIRIVSMVNSRKNKQIIIAQIQLIPIHTRMQLRHIIDRCNSEKSLKLSDIKPLMKDIAQILSQLLSESKSSHYQHQHNRNGEQSRHLKSTHGGHTKSVSSIIDRNSEHDKHENTKNQNQMASQIKHLQEAIHQQNEEFWKNIKSSVELKISEFNDRIQKIQLQHSGKIKSMILQSNQLKKLVIDQIDNKVQELTQLFTTQAPSPFSKKLDNLPQMIEKKEQKIQNQFNNKNENKRPQRYSKRSQKQEALQQRKQDYLEDPAKNLTTQIDSQCFCFHNILIEGNKIIAKNKVDLFGSKTLNNLKKKCQFSVKFLKMKVFGGIGIIDKDYKRQPQLNRVQNSLINQIRYWSDKDIRNGKQAKQNQGFGFAEEEKVTVAVDFNMATVQWKVNNTLRLKVTNNLLRNKSIKWVPYIYLNNEGDIVTLDTEQA